MLDKKRVKEFYGLGYNASEIANFLAVKRETVKKCIQRNFRNDISLFEQHIKNREEIKLKREVWKVRECKRAIDSTNNKYIGNAQLINWNRQSYKTNKSGRLVFDTSRGAIPGDLPKSYRQVCY
ncbi:hypothetical protein KQI36_15920 [Clostridium senegalense]|uniref:hypothetical protein n=1 Tax=Clostridium senegalense TaxID=1465809 RepID=UPI001294F2C7|nr:hypothetical protein [Clostridium senegalense]MBU5228119.1 hypothetical protein [Clostridium senegalense]MPU17738.1 hypothetical protein [Acinetobacter baumannii]